MLAAAQEVGAQTVLPPGTAEAYAEAVGATKFRATRWRLWAAAGLAAIDRGDDADALLRRGVTVGCAGFPHLVAELDGTCDLESTWFVLRLADDGVPAAARLAAAVKGTST